MARVDFDLKFCKQLIEHMACGCSYATFAAKLGCRLSTMRGWEKTHEIWSEAKELGELTCMYTWEKIIIGQANGDIKGLPATTIFALKNYFPEKFKENTALQGNGNTIVVFDSGVPSKIDHANGQNAIDAEVVEVKEIENKKPENTVSDQVKSNSMPDFLSASPVPNSRETSEITEELSVDDI